MSKPCYYSTLGVERNCSEDDLKRSYRRMAAASHPDKNQNNPEAEEKFKTINEAYETLRDSEKRAAYDRFGHSSGGRPQARGFNPFDVFSQGFAGNDFGPFSQFFGGHRQQSTTSSGGETVQQNIQITLEEAFKGAEKEFKYPSFDVCDQCSGSGCKGHSEPPRCKTCGGQGRVAIQNGPFQVVQECFTCNGSGIDEQFKCSKCGGQGRINGYKTVKVTLPKGIDNNSTLKMAGAGCAGIRKGPFGDLLLNVRIQTDPNFRREGQNLIFEREIPFHECLLGCSITVDRFGEEIDVHIHPLTPTNSIITVKGKGMSGPERHGDLQLYIKTTLPTELTEQQKEALKLF